MHHVLIGQTICCCKSFLYWAGWSKENEYNILTYISVQNSKTKFPAKNLSSMKQFGVKKCVNQNLQDLPSLIL